MVRIVITVSSGENKTYIRETNSSGIANLSNISVMINRNDTIFLKVQHIDSKYYVTYKYKPKESDKTITDLLNDVNIWIH